MHLIFKPDVDFLEDEMGLLVTYQSDYYKGSFRSAIMSVREQCQADYSDLCSLPNILATNLKGRRLHLPNPLRLPYRPPTDDLFMGGLGYGNPGNACMNQNYENLTPDCRYAVDHLYQTRVNYWQAVTDDGNGRNEGSNQGLIGALWMYHIIAFLACAIYYWRVSAKTVQGKRALAAQGKSNPFFSVSYRHTSDFCSIIISDSPGVPVASNSGECSVLVRLMGAVLFFFFMQLLVAMVAVLTVGRDPSSPMLAVGLVTGSTACFIAYMIGRSREDTFEKHSERHSEGRAPVSVAVTPSTVIFADDNDNTNDNDGNQGGSEWKNCVPIPCYATTTSTTTATTTASSTTTGPSSLATAIRSVMTFFIGRPSSDRDYTALPTDNSVHDSHDMVIGVPISAQQKL